MSNSKNMKTFEQRMREHRMQYEQERNNPRSQAGSGRQMQGNSQTQGNIRAQGEKLTYMDSMYMAEQEDDQYITVVHQQPESAAEVSAEVEEETVAVAAPLRQMPQQNMQNIPMQGDSPMQTPNNNMQQMPYLQQQGSVQRPNGMRSPQWDSPLANVGTRPLPETLENPLYTPGFLRTQIGSFMRVEFLIGTSMLNDRTGKLVDVGVSYIVLESLDGLSHTVCDIYSIKFITVIDTTNARDLMEIL